MKNNRRISLLLVFLLGSVGLLGAEVVEEETWYNAEGKVVKKVKRTYTGADADRTPDWEPQWVIRERERSSRSGRVWTSGRSWYSGSRGRTYFYRPWGYGTTHCGGYRTRGRSGFRGFYYGGSGGSRWGFSYRGPGISLRYVD